MPQKVAQTPTITAGAYSANDAVGGLLTFTIPGVRASVPVSGWVVGARLLDKAGQSVDADLVLFDAAFSPTADNGAFNPSDAELVASGIGFIAIDEWSQFAGGSIGQRTSTWIPFTTSDGKLYGQLVTRGTPSYGSTSDLTVVIDVMLDT